MALDHLRLGDFAGDFQSISLVSGVQKTVANLTVPSTVSGVIFQPFGGDIRWACDPTTTVNGTVGMYGSNLSLTFIDGKMLNPGWVNNLKWANAGANCSLNVQFTKG